jgi:hypothetical protein
VATNCDRCAFGCQCLVGDVEGNLGCFAEQSGF